VDNGVEFRILGALEVRIGGVPVRMRGPRQEKALAALLLDVGRVVSVERLVAAMWDDPPSTARRQVQDLITALRRSIGGLGGRDTVIATERGGYVARPRPEEFDAYRFERLVTAGRAAASTEPAAAAQALREALALCRGATLAGIESAVLRPAVAGWEERRLAVREEWLGLELALGNHHSHLGELAALVAEQPLREQPVRLLMLALHRGGRSPEALEAYQRLQARLAENLGVEPGPELRELYRALRRGDGAPGGGAPPAPAGAPGAAAGVPAQLPLDVRGFAGRARELATLDAILATTGDQPTAVFIAAVAGTAGVGKTALAVHWAHRVADRFPDGQLYVNLRGFDPSGSAVTAAEAVRGLLDALGVPPQRVPATLDGQAALYRSLMAGRRILVVLDNARDAGQVRPLLPGTPGCLVLVTSRNQLTGLVAAEGAHPIPLDLLTAAEARQFLFRRLGSARIDAEPEAVDAIIGACARLPLALAIVAARVATHTGATLAAAAGQLRRLRGQLDAFDGGDAATDLRAVFSWSYHTLGAPAARLFRLLSLHPGPEIGETAAASLAGVPPREARPLLAELTHAQLVAERVPGRYTFHDLLRAYATELALATESDADVRAAQHRMLDHYVHTGLVATPLLRPSRLPIEMPPPAEGTAIDTIASPADAREWFATDHAVLLAVLEHATDRGFDAHACRLAWALEEYLDMCGRWGELATSHHTALAAAVRLGDAAAQAQIHGGLARTHFRLGRYDEAHTHLAQAVARYHECGDRVGEGNATRNISAVMERQGRYHEALAHIQRSLELYPDDGYTGHRAIALNNIGWFLVRLGDCRRGLQYCRQALALQQEIGDRPTEASTWDSMGYAYHHLGDYRRAAIHYLKAVDIYRELDSRYHQARTLSRLGDTHLAAGKPEAARTAWRIGLAILTELDHPEAEEIRAKLDRPGAGDPDPLRGAAQLAGRPH
jgi:DNA-binding SARP family transcriptional activator/tetratricopeptide (TPR) repeat protein